MGLDKVGFELIDKEYERLRGELERSLTTKYAERDAKVFYSPDKDTQARERQAQALKTKNEMGAEMDDTMKKYEKRLFKDWGGSREAAYNMAYDFSGLPDSGKMAQSFNEKSKNRSPDIQR